MQNDSYKLFDELLAAVDIVDVISRYINVEKAGQNFKALCPFHDDRNPSLMISPSKHIFKCFVCNTGGNAINFVQFIEKTTYFNAAKKIAGFVNFSHEAFTAPQVTRTADPHEPLYEAAKDAALYYRASLMQEANAPARDYLNTRGITPELINKYEIGYAPLTGNETITALTSNKHSLKTLDDIGIVGGDVASSYDKNKGRIIFPLHNKDGRVVAFSARKFTEEDGPKYINSPETKIFNKSETLYNYHYVLTTQHAVKYVYLVEGFVDVIALDRANVLSVVALMGTAFSREHANMLRRLNKEIRLFLDSDEAGQMATVSVMKTLDNFDIPYRLVKQSEVGDDPDDILSKHGVEALRAHSEMLVDKTEYLFNYYKKSANLETLAGRRAFVESMMAAIINLKSRLEVDDYINKLSEVTGFSASILLDMYTTMRRKAQTIKEAEHHIRTKLPLKKTMSKLMLAERVVVLQMLAFPEALSFYNTHVKLFNDEIYRYIANYLNEKQTEEPVNYAQMLSHINASIRDENKKEQYSEEVLSLSEDVPTSDYSEDIMHDALRQINYERELALLEHKQAQELNASNLTEEARAPIIQKYLRAKRELQIKYRGSK